MEAGTTSSTLRDQPLPSLTWAKIMQQVHKQDGDAETTVLIQVRSFLGQPHQTIENDIAYARNADAYKLLFSQVLLSGMSSVPILS